MNSTRAASLSSSVTSGQSKDLRPVLLPLIMLLVGSALIIHDPQNGIRLTLTLGIFLILGALVWRAHPLAGGAIITFLALLGCLRRFLLLDFGWSAMDSLVLISPALSIMSLVSMMVSRQIKRDTPMSKIMFILMLIMVVQIVNPLQGGLMVGLGGVLFCIGPLAWYYVGRRISGPQGISLLFRMVAFLAGAAACYGYKQLAFGFSDAEEAWMKTAGVASLAISVDATRVFSFFNSMQEYAIFLCVGVVIAWCMTLQKNVWGVFLLLLLTPALFLAGGRGPVVVTTLACSVMWAIQSPRKDVWLPRLITAMVLGTFAVGWSLQNADTSSLGKGVDGILAHQKEGLLDPSNSTLGGHFELISGGILVGLKNPLGRGLGATTVAASKFGTDVMNSEMDFSNMFISLGAIGGIIYCCLIYNYFKQTHRLWRATYDRNYQLIIGILVVVFGQWLNGNLYSLVFLIWFTAGYVDSQYSKLLAWNKEQEGSNSGSKSKPSVQRLGRRRPSSPRPIGVNTLR